MDAVIVRWLARKAKKLARKWGGQCIVFIDEIDAVGMRRQALGGGGVGGMSTRRPMSFHDLCFYGPNGALNPSGDLILESRAWRERVFAQRADEPRCPHTLVDANRRPRQPGDPRGMFGGGGGQLALNQLLVVMDGIDNPPFFKRRCGPTASTPSWTRPTSSPAGSAATRCGSRSRSRAATRSTSSAPRTSRSRCSTRL